MVEKITVPIPKPKKRIGVLPTRREVVKVKKHPRQDKHKGKDQS
jgi:hypothetical protein